MECASSADFFALNEAIGKVPEASANTQSQVVVAAPVPVVAAEPVQQIVQEVVRDVQQQYEPAQQILIQVPAPQVPVQEPLVVLDPALPAVVIPEPVDVDEPQAPIVIALNNEPVQLQEVTPNHLTHSSNAFPTNVNVYFAET